MARARSRVMDYLVYLLVRVLICIIQILPFRMALRVAHALAWLAHCVDRRHRLVADDNLQHAFPGQYSETERARMVRSVYQHFCTMLIEIVFLGRLLHPSNWHRHLHLSGGKYLVDCLLMGRPVFLVTAHFGNWEVGGYMMGMLGFTTNAIARRLDNPYLHSFLDSFRGRTGQTLLDKNTDYPRIQAVLEAGGVIATLGDQDAGQKGLFVPFFGRPASTHKAIALMSLEYNVPLLVMLIARVGEGLQFDAMFGDLILPEDYRGQPDAVRVITERFTQAVERLIRQYPEQYFWLHRRWKHQPPVRKAKKAG